MRLFERSWSFRSRWKPCARQRFGIRLYWSVLDRAMVKWCPAASRATRPGDYLPRIIAYQDDTQVRSTDSALTQTRLIARLVGSRSAAVARTSSRVLVDRRRIARSRDIRKRYPGRQDDRRQDTWTAHPSRSRPLPLSSFRHLPHPLFLSSPLSLFLFCSLLFHHYMSAPV